MKRAQVSIFIIIGLIILLIAGVLIYFHSRAAKEPFEQALPDITELPDFRDPQLVVEQCFDKLGKQAIYTVAKQGGYLNPKGDYRYAEAGDGLPMHYYAADSVVPYVVHKNNSVVTLRNFSDAVELLGHYVAVHAEECVKFDSPELVVNKPRIDWVSNKFNWSNASVDYSEEKVRVEFFPGNENVLYIDATYPVKVESKEYVKEVSSVAFPFPLRLKALYDIASELAEMIAASNGVFDVTRHCQELSAFDKKVNIYVSENAYRQAYVVSVVDSSPVELGLAPLRFQFAVRNIEVVGRCVG